MVFHYLYEYPERRVTTHTVKFTRPAGPVPIYYEIYAIYPAHWRHRRGHVEE